MLQTSMFQNNKTLFVHLKAEVEAVFGCSLSTDTVVAGGTTREALSHLLGFLTSTRHKSHLDNQISV